MPYIVLAGLAFLFFAYGMLQTMLKKRRKPLSSLSPFSHETGMLRLACAGVGIIVLLLCSAIVSAVILFLFLLFLLLLGIAYTFLTLLQKKDASYCAQGLRTLAKQGGQFFMTLFALFIEFFLTFVGVA